MLDDLIYFVTLTTSITLGSYYKRIEDVEGRCNYGTGLGVIISLLICRQHVYHIYLMIWVNAVILKCCHKRYVHHFSLIYTWLHLLYLHINLTNAQYAICIIQNIALRVVGLSFEIHSEEIPIKPSSSVKVSGDTENVALDPSVADIISYALFFIGLHKGPYYRFKIYKDHLKGSNGNLGNSQETANNIWKGLFFLIGYAMLRIKYSPKIFEDPTFYKYDADTRYLYNVPLLIQYFLKEQIVMLLCASVYTEAGFGVPLPGHGPSTKRSLLEFGNNSNRIQSVQALTDEYNFNMVRCFDRKKLLLGPRMRDTLQSWDMSTRYWFRTNINNSWIRANKEIRSACSCLAWTLWSGPSLQHIIIASTLWVYTRIEAEYISLYNTDGPMKLAWNIGFSIMRMFCLLYLTPCLLTKDAATVLLYYNSIFWVIHIILLVLIVGAIVSYKSMSVQGVNEL